MCTPILEFIMMIIEGIFSIIMFILNIILQIILFPFRLLAMLFGCCGLGGYNGGFGNWNYRSNRGLFGNRGGGLNNGGVGGAGMV